MKNRTGIYLDSKRVWILWVNFWIKKNCVTKNTHDHKYSSINILSLVLSLLHKTFYLKNYDNFHLMKWWYKSLTHCNCIVNIHFFYLIKEQKIPLYSSNSARLVSSEYTNKAMFSLVLTSNCASIIFPFESGKKKQKKLFNKLRWLIHAYYKTLQSS